MTNLESLSRTGACEVRVIEEQEGRRLNQATQRLAVGTTGVRSRALPAALSGSQI
jgi:hypothetical protein